LKIDDVYKEYEKDSVIDQTDLHNESLNIPMLHAKYYRLFSHEKMVLRRLEADLKLLKKAKYEFYSQGPSKEQVDAGWELPARGLILKADIPMYLDADKDIIDLSLKIGLQQEKVEFLESVTRGLVNSKGFSARATIIKNAIDFMKWTQGG